MEQIKMNIGVWEGVKIGFGMFVILPILLAIPGLIIWGIVMALLLK